MYKNTQKNINFSTPKTAASSAKYEIIPPVDCENRPNALAGAPSPQFSL